MGGSPQRGLARSPSGGLGAEPPATFLRRSRRGLGRSPQFHSCGESDGGAPSNRKLSCFGIGGQRILYLLSQHFIFGNPSSFHGPQWILLPAISGSMNAPSPQTNIFLEGSVVVRGRK